MRKMGNVLWGVVLIGVGCIFGLNALEITDINVFFNGWWTLFIIIPCFIGIITDHDKTGNLIGLLIGCALLLACQDVIEFDMIWKLIWPIILIIIGFSFIFRDTINHKIGKEIKKLNKDGKNSNEYCATFANQDIDFDDEEFKGADLSAVFGGIKLDLRKAKITNDQVINTTAVFGGIEIYVPNDVDVKVKSTPIFGGVSNKTLKNKAKDKHIIYINATSIFGGVEIK